MYEMTIKHDNSDLCMQSIKSILFHYLKNIELVGQVYWTLDVSFNFIYNFVLNNFCFNKHLATSQDFAHKVLAEI
jgi:hypothetical protein